MTKKNNVFDYNTAKNKKLSPTSEDEDQFDRAENYTMQKEILEFDPTQRDDD